MLGYIKENDRLQSIFLEVMDDPSKKELILYLLCYVQLVRKIGQPSMELGQFLMYTNKSFTSARNSWKDILVELNTFVISDLLGNVYTGKDIYKVEDTGLYFIRIEDSYHRDINSLSSKVIRYWGIVSKISSYGKRINVYDAVRSSCLMFNERLYDELEAYCALQRDRFSKEARFFDVLNLLSSAIRLQGRDKKEAIVKLDGCLKNMATLGDIYYSVNIHKLRKDVEGNLKRLQKNKSMEDLKIEFVIRGKNREPLLKRLLKSVKALLGKLRGNKRWTLMNSETKMVVNVQRLF